MAVMPSELHFRARTDTRSTVVMCAPRRSSARQYGHYERVNACTHASLKDGLPVSPRPALAVGRPVVVPAVERESKSSSSPIGCRPTPRRNHETSALGALCAILTYDPCSPMSRRYCIVGGGSSWTATGRDIDPDLRAAARLPFAASTSPVIS
jgi:hypothetical protein